MLSDQPQSFPITPSRLYPTARDPCPPFRVSNALQQTSDRSTPPSQNISPQTSSCLCHLQPRLRRLCQTPSAPPRERLHLQFPRQVWFPTGRSRARAATSPDHSKSWSCRYSAAHRDNPTAERERNTAPAAIP